VQCLRPVSGRIITFYRKVLLGFLCRCILHELTTSCTLAAQYIARLEHTTHFRFHTLYVMQSSNGSHFEIPFSAKFHRCLNIVGVPFNVEVIQEDGCATPLFDLFP